MLHCIILLVRGEKCISVTIKISSKSSLPAQTLIKGKTYFSTVSRENDIDEGLK